MARALGLALLVGALAAGCGGDSDPRPVALSPPAPPAPQILGLCADLNAALPDRVDNSERRPVDPVSALTAAWGDPAVILRCGIARPSGLMSTSQLETINGVDFLVEERPGERVFTAVGRAVYVELTVPAAHDPQVGPAADVAAALLATLPARPEEYDPTVTAKPGH